MIKIIMMLITSAVVLFSALASSSDEELRYTLCRATQYIDNPHGSRAAVRYAIQQAGGDSNRVVSLMKQMIGEGSESSTAAFYITEIGKYGTTNDIPFLYRQVAATNLCETVTRAILAIEGLTTNSVATVTSLLPSDSARTWDAVCARCLLLEESEKSPSASPAKAMVLANALDYASGLTNYVDILDGSITRVDPSYRMSKRRLGVLRAVQNLGVNEWQTNFVATAIRELEAYPEANLPE